VELYSGPEYEVFFKYSFIMKLVFFSFIYGLAMPIVFPITLLALLNQYVFEKFAIAYFYKKPPSYDQVITLRAVEILRFAPSLGLFVACWLMGNQQMFGTKI
jgi:hypothetical protein